MRININPNAEPDAFVTVTMSLTEAEALKSVLAFMMAQPSEMNNEEMAAASFLSSKLPKSTIKKISQNRTIDVNPDDRGGTGHGDISYSDADPGL